MASWKGANLDCGRRCPAALWRRRQQAAGRQQCATHAQLEESVRGCSHTLHALRCRISSLFPLQILVMWGFGTAFYVVMRKEDEVEVRQQATCDGCLRMCASWGTLGNAGITGAGTCPSGRFPLCPLRWRAGLCHAPPGAANALPPGLTVPELAGRAAVRAPLLQQHPPGQCAPSCLPSQPLLPCPLCPFAI